MSCTSEELHNTTNHCGYITASCSSDSVINMYNVYYCLLSERNYLAVPLAIIVMVYLFYIVGIAGHHFLCPALSSISTKLKMSESLAGVTLLALGNGACDLIAGFIASGGETEGGVSVSLGSYFGSTILVTGFVCPMVIFFSAKDVKMPRKIFLKDMLFLLLSYLVILLFSFVGELNMHMAIMLLLMYVGYIMLVVVMELRQRDKHMRPPKQDESTIGIEFQERSIISMPKDESAKFYEKSQQLDRILEDEHINPGDLKQLMGLAEYHSTSLSRLRYGIQWRLFKVRLLMFDSIKNEEWKDMKWYSRILYVPIGALFTGIMRISIPPTGEESWDRRFASLFPIFAFSLVAWQFHLYKSILIIVIGGGIAVVSALAIYCSTHRSDPPAIMLLFSSLAFIMSLIWLYMMVNIIIDMLQVAIMATDIDDSYIGLTFLAIGNSVSDIVAEISISILGFTEMAMVGAFAGPVFLMLVGLPCAIIPRIMSKGPIHFDFMSIFHVSSDEMLLMVTLVFNIFALCVFMFLSINNKYQVEKFIGRIEIIIYIAFFVVATILVAIKQLSA